MSCYYEYTIMHSSFLINPDHLKQKVQEVLFFDYSEFL